MAASGPYLGCTLIGASDPRAILGGAGRTAGTTEELIYRFDSNCPMPCVKVEMRSACEDREGIIPWRGSRSNYPISIYRIRPD